ncbi:alpha/beta fold hydrolase [Streptosporangium vulgare]|uniref:Alpha/beta fold hydrolase n=1 Tax=Streptosporangium vulgare TaxID=46190 RepID=A0ABV5TNP7_9ACTN
MHRFPDRWTHAPHWYEVFTLGVAAAALVSARPGRAAAAATWRTPDGSGLLLRPVLRGRAGVARLGWRTPGQAPGLSVQPREPTMTTTGNIVLVHGGFVDGSGWRGVHDELTRDGLRVHIAQNPTRSLEDDVAVTRRVLDGLDGPAVLVGHSYGGAVISEAGTHPNVASLVYVAAFAPDRGESVSTLTAAPPPGAPVPPVLPPVEGFLLLDRDRFAASFAADLPGQVAAFMADSQVPCGVDALAGAVTEPAWRHKPSWYLVATEDRMIPPPAQRAMAERAQATAVEVIASHAVHISQPAAVADLIREAAA